MEYLDILLDWVGAHAAWAGPLVFLVAFLESLVLVGLIMPGALLMFGFGALVGGGHLSYWPIMLWATAGAILGDSLSYLLGRLFGPSVWTWGFFLRRPQLLERSVVFFQRHGGKSVVFGRFIGPLRPVVPMVAGMMKMRAAWFLTINVLSGLVWAPVYLLPGQVLAASVNLAAAMASRLSVLILFALLSVWLVFGATRWLLRTLDRRGIARRVIASWLMLTVFGVTLVYAWWQWESARVTAEHISWSEWRDDPWERLPPHRQGLLDSRQPFSFQVAARSADLARALVQSGWQLPERFDGRGALLWLSPEVDLIRVPPLPKRHQGQLPMMMFIRYYQGNRLVFRAWRSHLAVGAANRSVWLVTVEQLELQPGWPWLKQRTLAVPASLMRLVQAELGQWLPSGSLCAAPGEAGAHHACIDAPSG